MFPSLKRRADLYKRSGQKGKTIFRITGSNQIILDKTVKESLAGRASFYNLNTLSVSEVIHSLPGVSIQDIIFHGGWPELYANGLRSPVKYLNDYIASVIEKDIVMSAGIQKGREFLMFVRLLAGRSDTILEFSSLGRELGVNAQTLKDWTSSLERMNYIALVPSYSNNLTKRLTKFAKIFFIETGLACWCQRYLKATYLSAFYAIRMEIKS